MLKSDSMWLSEKEAEIIERYRLQSDERKQEIYNQILLFYDEAVNEARKAGETEEKIR